MITNKTDQPGKVINEPLAPMSMNPKKFNMWLFLVSVMMMFGAFTSGYIVRRAEGNWLNFDLPSMFYVSTVVIVLSSLSVHWAYLGAKKDEIGRLKIFLVLSGILGAAFLVLQFAAYQQLVAANVYFAGNDSNPSGSFLYVISGVHAVHVVSAVIYLFVTIYRAFNYRIHAKSLDTMEMFMTYWHFLGLLWVMLFFFLQVLR